MRITFRRAVWLIVALATLLQLEDIARAQDHAQRLRNPARVRGFIGGESHDSYVIRARRGQVMTVRISWQHVHDSEQGDNFADFWVGSLPDFDGDGLVKFGKEAEKGKSWSGKIPKTGNYYIYVVAHPTAHYSLRVAVK